MPRTQRSPVPSTANLWLPGTAHEGADPPPELEPRDKLPRVLKTWEGHSQARSTSTHFRTPGAHTTILTRAAASRKCGGAEPVGAQVAQPLHTCVSVCACVCASVRASPPLPCVYATSTPLPGLPPRATRAPPQLSGSPRLGTRSGSPFLNLSPPPTDAAKGPADPAASVTRQPNQDVSPQCTRRAGKDAPGREPGNTSLSAAREEGGREEEKEGPNCRSAAEHYLIP